MKTNINAFLKRWDILSRETLSAVRSEYNAYSFDIQAVDKAFQRACDEWFDGSLGPSVWYKELSSERPEIARRFKEYVKGIRFTSESISKPSNVWSYVTTLLSLPVCYGLLEWLTEMGRISKVLTTIGTAVLVWYVGETIVKGKRSRIEDQVTEFYRDQLDKHLKAIEEILSDN